MQNDAPAAPIEIVKRRIEVNPLGVSERLDHAGKERDRLEIRPDSNSPPAQAQSPVWYQDRRVGALLHTQPLTDRAPAQRTVERKMMRRQLVEAATAPITHSVLAEAVDRPARLA